MNATAPEQSPTAEDHAYFLAIERAFLALRRKAALLTAADWQEAQSWHRQGIPVELIQNVMESLFERQAARKGRTISGLRYFRAAVDAAWEELAALQAGGRTEERPELPVRVRLENLASKLPPSLLDRARWSAAITALAPSAAPPNNAMRTLGADEVETALRHLDADLLRALRPSLEAEASRRLQEEVERALLRLRGRLPEGDLAVAAARLEEQLLRRHFEVPVLSLFSSEARGEGDASDSGA